jgi:hypothetical protein
MWDHRSGSGRVPASMVRTTGAEANATQIPTAKRSRGSNGGGSRIRTCGMMALATATVANALTFTPVPSANLDFSQLGKVGIAGDFSGISQYEYAEQTENGFEADGSESLLAQLPNGALTSVISTDASIHDMCRFDAKGDSTSGVVIGGNFTSVQGTQSQGIALFDYESGDITPWTGLSGQVNALLCDEEANTVYVGGNFIGTNSTNAISWVGGQGWTNLPFAGFNGPVTSITKASNGNVIFGGSFTGLGNATSPSTPDGQVINLGSANITSGSTSTADGFSNPDAIICSTGNDGSGSTWLLEDNSPGFWRADFGFTFEPTKLRLHNTHQDGRGTKTWRFTALPLGGILNFTYTDPASGTNLSCTSECPLSDDTSVEFQDFHFVNNVGMNAFRIDISDYYGSGGGLNKVELFSDGILSYAVAGFNEPDSACSGSDFPSTATATGPWATSPSMQSMSRYLTASLSGDITPESASVTFFPDIRESGNYSVNIFTPGCLQDGTCESRAQVNITGVMSSSSEGFDFQTSIFQTNNFEKYDQIYFGFVDASSDEFRPSVTITPLAGQNVDTMTFVAQMVGFTLINSTGGLNGLFEFDPSVKEIDTSTFSSSAINKLGSSFSSQSAVAALATSGDVTYVGGNFTSSSAKNIVSVNIASKTVTGLDGGLNGEVAAMYLNGTNLFVGGEFSNTMTSDVSGLSNVGVYDTKANAWSALGGGVNGKVAYVVPMTISIDGGDTNTTVIGLTGDFTQLAKFDDNDAVDVSGFAIWVPSKSNWLQNLGGDVPLYDGILTGSVLDLPTGDLLYAGALSSSQLGASGAVSLSDDGFAPFDIKMDSSPISTSSRLARRADTTSESVSGVVAGTFFEQDDKLSTVLAGHFTAQDSDGNQIQNLAILTDGDEPTVIGLPSGVDSDSTFVTVDVYGTTLYAGGNVTGTIDNSDVVGLVSYDLSSNDFTSQPQALAPSNSTVSAIAVRSVNGDVYVGGSFARAGSLGCPGVCYFSSSQWNRPGVNLDGIVDCLLWVSDTKLLAGGDIRINSSTNVSLASYDVDNSIWTAYPGADSLPGPISAMTLASNDGSQIWVSGTNNGSAFVAKYDGSKWVTAPSPADGTVVQNLQVFSLTQDHASSDLLDSHQVLMLTGHIVISDKLAASAAIFNGTDYVPYALTSGSSNSAGTISKVFTQTQNFFTTDGECRHTCVYHDECLTNLRSDGDMPLVFIVLIGLAISLGLILLIVAAGILMDRFRKKRDGYTPAPTAMQDRGTGMQRIPPQELFEGLNRTRSDAPQV